jgi:hypothetical protein
MDLGDTNYKFMDLVVDFQSLWNKLQVYGPRNAISKLMDLSDTFLQDDGPLVHFTLFQTSLPNTTCL